MTEPAEAPPRTSVVHHHWFQKLSAVVFIIFCLELGLFLIIYPWTDEWDHNMFAAAVRLAQWNEWWNSPFLKGALSGLGLLNVWVSVAEIFRLRRFSNHS